MIYDAFNNYIDSGIFPNLIPTSDYFHLTTRTSVNISNKSSIQFDTSKINKGVSNALMYFNPSNVQYTINSDTSITMTQSGGGYGIGLYINFGESKIYTLTISATVTAEKRVASDSSVMCVYELDSSNNWGTKYDPCLDFTQPGGGTMQLSKTITTESTTNGLFCMITPNSNTLGTCTLSNLSLK